MSSPNLILCPDCSAEVSRNAYLCPKCGAKIRSTPINLLAKIILGFIALCVAAWMITLAFNAVVTAVPADNPDAGIVHDIQRRQQEAYLKELRDREKKEAK